MYIAGPFSPTATQKLQLELVSEQDRPAARREFVERNIARAVQLGIKVAKLGACPIVPHANTAHPEYEEVQPYTFWIEATGEQLRRCDAVLFTEDWESSSGARNENEIAIDEAIPRFFHLSDLAAFLNHEDLTRLGLNWAQPSGSLPTDPVDPTWLPTPPPEARQHGSLCGCGPCLGYPPGWRPSPAPQRVTESEADWNRAKEADAQARQRRLSPSFSSRPLPLQTKYRPNTGN